MKRTVIYKEEKYFKITSYVDDLNEIIEPYNHKILYCQLPYKNDEECEELLEKAKKDYAEKKPYNRKPPILETFWAIVSKEIKYD